MTLGDGTTFYLGTQGEGVAGVYWEPLLAKDGAVSSGSAFMASDVQLATMTFTILDQPTSYAGGRTFSAMLAEHDFVGADVVLVIAPRGIDITTDGLQKFVGVVQSLSVTTGEVKFRAKQGRDWNRVVQPVTVTRAGNPAALEATVGSVIPIALGRLGGQPMRPPFANPYGDEFRIRELIAGGLRAGQAVVIDAGRGGFGATTTRAKIAVASHAVKQLGSFSPNWGTSPFLEQSDGKLHSVDPLLADVFNNDTDGAGFYLPDGTASVYAPVFPVDIELGTNYADSPRAVLDPANEFTSARFDYAGGKRFLYARLPNLENFGKLNSIIVYVIYRGGPSVTLLKVFLNNTKKGVAQGGVVLVPTAGYAPGFVNINVATTDLVVPTNPWEWGDCRIDIYFDGVGTGTAEVIACGVAVQYAPKRDVLESRKVVESVQVQRTHNVPGERRRQPVTVTQEREVMQNVTEVRGKFYSNVYGRADDVSGTYTGTPSAVIERAPDVARYILETFGGVPLGGVVTGVGEFGSFVDARAALKTRRGTDSVIGLMLSEEVDINAAIAWVADACASEPILSEFTNQWEFHPWRVDPPLTYALPISRYDLLDPEATVGVEMTPDTDVLSSLRVVYGWDARSRSYLHETTIGANKSVSGHFYRNLRDASCAIVLNVNDKLDWTGTLTGAHTYTIGAGNHTPTQLLSALHSAFTATHAVGLGAIIATGVNDKLPIYDGANKTVTLDPGDYGTMEALAAHVQTKLNQSSTLWTAVYSPTTRKFTFGRTTGVGNFTFGLVSANTCASTLGWNCGTDVSIGNPGISQTAVSLYECEVGHVSISTIEEFNLNWKSGPNGLDGTKRSAWEALGFDWVADQLGIGLNIKRHMGWCPKSDTEKLLANADLVYGQRRAVTRDARALYDTPTALALRDRLVTLRSKSRALVSFSSEVLADMRRGDVFEFHADMDTLKPYPVPGSGGSWVGRKFRVLETLSRFGGSWHTEVVAIDVTD